MNPALTRAASVAGVFANAAANAAAAAYAANSTAAAGSDKIFLCLRRLQRVGFQRRCCSAGKGGKNEDDLGTSRESESKDFVKTPRRLNDDASRTPVTSSPSQSDTLTSWQRSIAGGIPPLILSREALKEMSRSFSIGRDFQGSGGGGGSSDGSSGGGVEGSGGGTGPPEGDSSKKKFLKSVKTETLQNLMRSLFYIPLTEGGCALGFFTRVSMQDLAQQWSEELQNALTDIAGAGRNLEDTWACGLVTSCNVFRKAVNVSDQFPLVSALSGKTFMFEFDNILNYSFSDPFIDIAFVQLTPMQIWNAQLFEFVFLPMRLALQEDIYDDGARIDIEDIIIAKQSKAMSTVITQSHEGVDAKGVEALEEYLKTFNQESETTSPHEKLFDDSPVSGAAPAVNQAGELVGISKKKLQDTELLFPTRMLSGAIAADLHSQIDLAKEPSFVFRPEWMDFKIRYTDLHNLGLLKHPLAHNNEDMLDFVDWPFYEVWYERTAPLNNLSFVLTHKYWYMRPEEEYRGEGREQ